MTEILIAGAAMAVLCLAALYFLRREDEAIMSRHPGNQIELMDYFTETLRDKALLDATATLLRLRIQSKITQHELAERMNTSVSSVVKHEHGQIPTIDWLWSYAEALGKTLIIKIGDENA